MSGELSGADEFRPVSARVESDLVDEFDEWVDQSAFDSRSEAIRSYMVSKVGQREREQLHPPADETLADTYDVLCDLAGRDGTVRGPAAESLVPQHVGSLTKDRVYRAVSKLDELGYVDVQNSMPPAEYWAVRVRPYCDD